MTPPGNCFMSHITSHYMLGITWGHLWPFRAPVWYRKGPKSVYLLVKLNYYCRLVMGWRPQLNPLMSHNISHHMAITWPSHGLGPYCFFQRHFVTLVLIRPMSWFQDLLAGMVFLQGLNCSFLSKLLRKGCKSNTNIRHNLFIHSHVYT